jgi:hypothetical protein
VSFRRKIQQWVVGGGEWGNSSPKAFGVSVADTEGKKKKYAMKTGGGGQIISHTVDNIN